MDIAERTLQTLEGVDRYNRWIFERIRPGLGQRVLEIGCGTGTITQFLADRELVVKLESAGFRVDAVRRSNPIGAVGWAVNNCLLRRRHLGGVGIYERLVPALSWLDQRVEFPVGLSLTARASKV